MTNNKIHEGRNVKRFREMLGIKQDALAADLGEDWNQKKISMLEAKETIDPALLQEISAVLKYLSKRFRILMRNKPSISFQILLTTKQMVTITIQLLILTRLKK